LSWNGKGEKRTSIIIGLVIADSIGGRQLHTIPIYKIKTADDGELKIPGRFFNQLPLDRFEKIVFTFVRSYEGYRGSGANELLVSSQSIHSIIIDIP